ncbi:hypothetical protein ABMC89_02895 [Sulfitobacter sp. HNIBRBA3233]|uniref:hypothetical protein n=1 Tax=Sulfitobacter marinivivus TaxID=3158558 RepID=UPI0032DFB1CD
MFRLLWRQRRCLLFGGFFASLALMMMVLDRFGIAALGPLPPVILSLSLLLTTLIVAAGVMALGAVVVIVLPRWRSLLELGALAFFVTAALQVLVPALYEIPYIGGFVPFILTLVLVALIYGEALDRFRLPLDNRSCRSIVSPLDPQSLWETLVPGAAPVSAHWDPLLHDITPIDGDPDRFEATYTHGGSLYEHRTITFLDRNAPFHAKYDHVGRVNPKSRSLVEGTYEITITPLGDRPGCRVTLCARMTEALPRVAIARWFDDELGDRADYLRARQRGKRDWSMAGLYRCKVAQFA